MNRTKHLSYKTLSAIVLIVALFAYLPGAPAQTLLPARQVSVSTNAFTNLSPAVATAQSTFEAIDQSSLALSVAVASNTAAVASNTASLSAVVPLVQSNNALVVSNAALVSTMSGVVSSNAATMAYNARANNWNFTNTLLSVFLDLFANTNDSYRVILDRPAFTSNYLAAIALNDTNALTMPGLYSNMYARLDTLFSNHFTTVVVPYSESAIYTGVGSLRDEIMRILAELGFESYVAYTWGALDTYMTTPWSYANPPNIQTYVVPTNFAAGTIIKVNAWGGGSAEPDRRAGAGGYSSGNLVVVTNGFDQNNASHVTNGMVLAVQVGSVGRRAAVWRIGNYTNYHTMTNEILVAGGGAFSWGGGAGGGASGTAGSGYGAAGGGGGATSSAGGAAGMNYNNLDSAGAAYSPAETGVGRRVWGARYGFRYEAAPGQGQPAGFYPANAQGGDGYYGGGAGGWSSNWDCGNGGGGSGYVAPSLTNGVTTTGGTSAGPSGQDEKSYNGFAGKAGNGGRVAFVVPFRGLDSPE